MNFFYLIRNLAVNQWPGHGIVDFLGSHILELGLADSVALDDKHKLMAQTSK